MFWRKFICHAFNVIRFQVPVPAFHCGPPKCGAGRNSSQVRMRHHPHLPDECAQLLITLVAACLAIAFSIVADGPSAAAAASSA